MLNQHASQPDPERDEREQEQDAAREDRRFRRMTYTDGEYTNPMSASPPSVHIQPDSQPAPASSQPAALPDWRHYEPPPTIPALDLKDLQRRAKAERQRNEAARAADINAENSPYVQCQPVAVIAPGLTVRTKPDPLEITCPQCQANRFTPCTNYAGKRCATHSRRKAEAAISTARRITEYFPVPPPPPPPPAPAQQLAAAVEALVAEHGCGSVIDAAWAASKRLFKPAPQERRS